uniref:adenine phosphoribosyltransferase n=1 Tax=Arundo donax TaxID=35708 RepID=A0A0A9E2V6_ARUDO
MGEQENSKNGGDNMVPEEETVAAAVKENGRGAAADPRLQGISDAIRVVPHFPKPGIEARGFIFGPAIALAIGAKFIPLRKPKKLPGEVFSEHYALEYGTDCLEMHVGAIEQGERVVVVDDLVATGGTLSAAIRLLERAGADVVECACLIGVPKFKVSIYTFFKVQCILAWILFSKSKLKIRYQHADNVSYQ